MPPLLLYFQLYILSSLLLATFFTSNVQAIPLRTIDITINYYTPQLDVIDSGIDFGIFESASNIWATPTQWQGIGPTLALGGGVLKAGLTKYSVSLPVTNLSNIYISLFGGFNYLGEYRGIFNYYTSIFVAEPTTGWVSDDQSYIWGPPWISLGNMAPGHGLSGDLKIIHGIDDQAETSHPWVVGTWEVSMPVPEPASLLLLGVGLTGLALVIWRRRQS